MLKIGNHFFQAISAEKTESDVFGNTLQNLYTFAVTCFVTRQTEHSKEMHMQSSACMVSSTLYKTVSLIVPLVYSVLKFSSRSPAANIFFTISSHQELHAPWFHPCM